MSITNLGAVNTTIAVVYPLRLTGLNFRFIRNRNPGENYGTSRKY